MRIYDIFSYLWIISISTGLVFYTVGEKGILFLFLLMTISSGSIKINRNFIYIFLPLMGYMVFKFIDSDILRTSEYHSVYAELVSVFTVMIALLCVGSLAYEKRVQQFIYLNNL